MEVLLGEMEEYAEEHHIPIINKKGRGVLVETVSEVQPQRVLEIGTAIGYSSLLIAQEAACDAAIVTLELDEERAATALDFIARSPFSTQIHILLGDAGETLVGLQGPFDLVFIDAAKGQYPDYFRKVLPILSETGVIIADNVLFRGYVRGTEESPRRYKTIVKRLREYIEMVEKAPGFTTEIYENGDGLAVSKRRKNE
ncbi:MAG: O-methyltransferase [Selenomonadaceae bacterium]